MRKLFEILALATILAISILPSCTKDNFDMDRLSGEISYDGSFAIPLAYSNVSFYKIIGVMDTSFALQDNDDGYLSMFYNSYVESKRVQDLLNLGPQHFEKTIGFSELRSRGINAGSQLHYETEEVISFTLMNENTENGEAEIDSLALNSGTLEYTIESTFGFASKVVVEFPSIKKGGHPLKDSISLYSTDSYDHRTLSLAGYTIDLTTTSKHFNEIPVKIKTVLDCGSSVPSMGAFSITLDIYDFNYKGLYGYLGRNELLFQSDTIDITMFKQNPKYDWEHSQFYFKKPRLTVTYWNSYGVPAMFYFTELDAYMQATDITWNINNIITPDFPLSESTPFILNSPIRPGDEVEGMVTVNADNSHIDELIPNRPTWLHFAAKAETNPGTSHEHNSRNFIDGDSKVKAKIEVEIPLYGHLYNFVYRDTADIDISSYVGNLPIKRMAVMLNVKNNMPVKANAQFYLVDENYNVLDSLIQTQNSLVLDAARVDANGRLMTNEPATAITKIELTREQIENLSNSRHMLIKFVVNTAGDAYGGQDLKLYRDYGFKANIGLDVDLDVEANVKGN